MFIHTDGTQSPARGLANVPTDLNIKAVRSTSTNGSGEKLRKESEEDGQICDIWHMLKNNSKCSLLLTVVMWHACN